MNELPDTKELNILYHINYYNGGGVATGDFNNDGLTDIYFTANKKGKNKLYLNKGNFEFEDITTSAGVAGSADWCSGVTLTDVNADGLLDIYVCAVTGKLGLKGRNELFINNGNNTFTEAAEKYGLAIASFAQQAAFFDYDKDGDLDCFILNQSEQPFTYIVDTSNRRKYDPMSGDKLLRNDCNTDSGRFVDVSSTSGIWQSKLGYGLGLGVADLNNDGWDDIYVSNDFHENDYCYINNRNGTFTDEGAKRFGHFSRFSMGNDIADYNNDGQPDIVTVDMLPPDEKTLKTYGSDEQFEIYRQKIVSNGFLNQYSKNCLQKNNGNGESFSEVGLMSGVSATDWSWCPLFCDFDNDGRKDLFISSGIPKRPVDLDYVRFVSAMYTKQQFAKSNRFDTEVLEKIPDGASHPFVFKAGKDFTFTDISTDCGTATDKGYYTGSAVADFDNDGNMDIVINCINSKAVIYKNESKSKNFISFQLAGDSLNPFAAGAKVYLFNNGSLQYRQLAFTRGFQSASDPLLHFGLDTTSTVDSAVIVWPNDTYQTLYQLKAGKKYKPEQRNASGVFKYDVFFKPAANTFTNISQQVSLPWMHNENDFIDFNRQYLIPHEQSTRGPAVAVADVNKDGLDDLYLCGAKDQPGALYIQKPDGNFESIDTAMFRMHRPFEDVDAVFFDATNDGWPDLLVVSGGNELKNGDALLLDRLYVNDGTGHFVFTPDLLPVLRFNKSSISIADVDKDGDTDVFIGVLADAMQFGMPQDSYLLLNNGKGKFKQATNAIISLQQTGLVTTSCFADINNDTWPDLIVTGEWMPLKIFINNKGVFKLNELPSSTGLWQTIFPADVNGDGKTDLLAGNWGHNSKLYAGKNGPLKLYVKDFDRNGSVEQVMAYTINGKEYPFLAKDELERPLPVLKKVYLTYSEVAGKTVDYIFYDLFTDFIELKAEVLSSSCFINTGNGTFTRMDLPRELQQAPVMCFSELETKKSWMAAGNFYGVLPYEGRYDALMPSSFSFQPTVNSFAYNDAVNNIRSEVRDAVWLRYQNNRLLVLASNNGPLVFLKTQKP
jgi:enediyne biosynthesis protein E4